ncbi:MULTISPECIES: flagellar biosynthetic protein FliO [Pseudomonas syringae group]|uniref:Flagellar protein n=3 Tax=Pseudomonas syringae group TaxID=136849 RepID=A0AB37QME3_9PSED|nr:MULTISPECIES: flagellar biosynthetic protein FliO [Pseudomonas syringae group]KGS13006.1 flagellar assembly protein FliO [Pseudomonas coronafaciens]KOP52944.1 flagellar assembly protein FliO [Pseudomonas coronafaciens pv. porri]KOP61309.1 flagellar assembly protein FliO [Pseudomonas coronafaciens pv. porri]KPB55976.1 Flagellar protein FliO [Pseudomonas coronafaciens pv. oryzae]KPW33253.1 Flagellar protein FliO [Pseudomonas coronafaciens pv. atropurpurea]
MKRLLSVLLMSPSLAWAVDPAAQTAPAQVANTVSGGMGGQLAQLLFGLILVVGLIFVLAWLMRRVQSAGPNNSQVIELVGSRALGPRDRLVLVQIGNEQVLLGITPGRITPLHVLKEPVQVPVREQTTPEFAQRLMELMGKDKDKK